MSQLPFSTESANCPTWAGRKTLIEVMTAASLIRNEDPIKGESGTSQTRQHVYINGMNSSIMFFITSSSLRPHAGETKFMGFRID